jgi:hypothetical protein
LINNTLKGKISSDKLSKNKRFLSCRPDFLN